ncbi:MAG: hypothetical protein HYT03_00150 [Candidatus Harrisonbacteria bacterium]|nr:hypothetical protein [Candidatus Harrisonbacteria bacterium]
MIQKGFSTTAVVVLGIVVISAVLIGGFAFLKGEGLLTSGDDHREIHVFAEQIGGYSTKDRLYPMYSVFSYDPSSKQKSHNFNIGEAGHYVQSVAILPKNNKLVINEEKRIQLRDLTTGQKRYYLEGQAIVNLVASPDGDKLAVVLYKEPLPDQSFYGGYELILLDLETGAKSTLFDGENIRSLGGPIPGFVLFDWRDPETLYLSALAPGAGNISALYSFDLETNQLEKVLKYSGLSGKFSPNGKFFASAVPTEDAVNCGGEEGGPFYYSNVLKVYDLEKKEWVIVDVEPGSYFIDSWSDDEKEIFYSKEKLNQKYFELAKSPGKYPYSPSPACEAQRSELFEPSQKLVFNLENQKVRKLENFLVDILESGSDRINYLRTVLVDNEKIHTIAGTFPQYRFIYLGRVSGRLEESRDLVLEIADLKKFDEPRNVLILDLLRDGFKSLGVLPNEKVVFADKNNILIVDPDEKSMSKISAKTVLAAASFDDNNEIFFIKPNSQNTELEFHKLKIDSGEYSKIGSVVYRSKANYSLFAPTPNKILLSQTEKESNCEIWLIKSLDLKTGAISNFLNGQDCGISEYGFSRVQSGSVVSSRLLNFNRNASIVAILEVIAGSQLQFIHRYYDTVSGKRIGGLAHIQYPVAEFGFISDDLFLSKESNDEMEVFAAERAYNEVRNVGYDLTVPRWIPTYDIKKIISYNDNGLVYEDLSGNWWYREANGFYSKLETGSLVGNEHIFLIVD